MEGGVRDRHRDTERETEGERDRGRESWELGLGSKRKHEAGPAKEGLRQMAHELTHDVEA